VDRTFKLGASRVDVVASARGLAVCKARSRGNDGLQTETAQRSMEKQLIHPHPMRRRLAEMPSGREWMSFCVDGETQKSNMFKTDPPARVSDLNTLVIRHPKRSRTTKHALRTPEQHDPWQ
jgi:hypothetical protein